MKPTCPKCGKEGTPYYNLRNELQGHDCVPCDLTDLENIERWKYTTVDADHSLSIGDIEECAKKSLNNFGTTYDHKIEMTVIQNSKHTYETILIKDFKDTEVGIESILLDLDTGYLYAADIMDRSVFNCLDFRRDLTTIYRSDPYRKDMPRFVLQFEGGLVDLYLNTNERLVLIKELP